MVKESLKPKQRSRFRLRIGKAYYSAARHLLWHSGRFKFAQEHSDERLSHSYYSHETPLNRAYEGVDVQYLTNKIMNLKIATGRLNGLIIKPGETFSYWKLIGKPTAGKGYVPGMVLYYGTYQMGIGGGLCQLSNLIYWLTLHTPLTIVERYRHSYDVFPDSNRTQPFGSGATCFYPYRDLMIRNDTDSEYQLDLQVGETHLSGLWRTNTPALYRYEIIEKNHCFKSEYWGGSSRHNELYRQRFTAEGEYLDEEYITENHALMMYSPFLGQGE